MKSKKLFFVFFFNLINNQKFCICCSVLFFFSIFKMTQFKSFQNYSYENFWIFDKIENNTKIRSVLGWLEWEANVQFSLLDFFFILNLRFKWNLRFWKIGESTSLFTTSSLVPWPLFSFLKKWIFLSLLSLICISSKSTFASTMNVLNSVIFTRLTFFDNEIKNNCQICHITWFLYQE